MLSDTLRILSAPGILSALGMELESELELADIQYKSPVRDKPDKEVVQRVADNPYMAGMVLVPDMVLVPGMVLVPDMVLVSDMVAVQVAVLVAVLVVVPAAALVVALAVASVVLVLVLVLVSVMVPAVQEQSLHILPHLQTDINEIQNH